MGGRESEFKIRSRKIIILRKSFLSFTILYLLVEALKRPIMLSYLQVCLARRNFTLRLYGYLRTHFWWILSHRKIENIEFLFGIFDPIFVFFFSLLPCKIFVFTLKVVFRGQGGSSLLLIWTHNHKLENDPLHPLH